MSAKVHIEQTDTGFRVIVRDAEFALIETETNPNTGKGAVHVSFEADDDDQPAPTPLDVQLG